ncbi:putative RNA-directed DNA polymerase, eukaryota, reverse transcriptase zinc-binding domain protein [Tanacetum coccineum]
MCSVQIQRIFEEAMDNLSRKSNDSDNEDISSNGNVDPNEALDDFIQHVVEEKEVEKTPPRTPRLMTLNLLVKDNHTITHKDIATDEVVSDTSKSLSFENFIKEKKACSRSSSTSRAGKRLINGIDHIGRVILFGDLNEVRSESERFGSTFSCGDATIFNSFIYDTGLIDLLMGGRHFTWVNKVGSKMSKLDRFLISDNVLHSNTDLKVIALDRLWKSQMVQGIMLDGVWNSEPKDIKSAFLDFYKDKFSCHDSPVSFPPMLPTRRLSIADQDFLESMVSMDEIKAEVWDCGSQKALGSDGSNSAFITLIPKVSNPLFIKDYRPISLIGIHYKIVAKILANSLSKRYLDYVLDKLGFGIKWRNWIRVGLASARTSILINGSPTSEFSLKRGLRQGCPLLPFLFIIVMEGLGMALNDGLAANMFHGVKVGSPGIHLSHLFYADDVIILSEWNLNAMENIIRILNIFYIASGLKINIHKSNVYGVGVSSNEVEIMASYTGCKVGFFPFTYLGLPIGSK